MTHLRGEELEDVTRDMDDAPALTQREEHDSLLALVSG